MPKEVTLIINVRGHPFDFSVQLNALQEWERRVADSHILKNPLDIHTAPDNPNIIVWEAAPVVPEGEFICKGWEWRKELVEKGFAVWKARDYTGSDGGRFVEKVIYPKFSDNDESDNPYGAAEILETTVAEISGAAAVTDVVDDMI